MGQDESDGAKQVTRNLYLCAKNYGTNGDEDIIFNFSIGIGKAKMMPAIITSWPSLHSPDSRKNCDLTHFVPPDHFTYIVDKTVMGATQNNHLASN